MHLKLLPTELLEPIIAYTIPEGFEAFMLSCKDVFVLCKPFFLAYNSRRRALENSKYHFDDTDPRFGTASAYQFITRIAVDPSVARYFRTANSKEDGTRPLPPLSPADGTAISRLLDTSTNLAAADTNPRKFQTRMVEHLRKHHYSQGAAVFLLTLLPNLEKVRLPRQWDPLHSDTQRLLATTVQSPTDMVSGRYSHALTKLRSVQMLPMLNGPIYPVSAIQSCTSLPRNETFEGDGLFDMGH